MNDTGAWLKQRLQEVATADPRVVEVRGRGLIVGMELTEPARPIAERALGRGVLLNVVQGNVLRFLPSFLLERTHVNEAMDLIVDLLSSGEESVQVLSEPQLAAVR